MSVRMSVRTLTVAARYVHARFAGLENRPQIGRVGGGWLGCRVGRWWAAVQKWGPIPRKATAVSVMSSGGDRIEMAFDALTDRIKNLARLRSIEALLDWDQETQMPPGGVAARAEQTALVAGLAHEQLISDDTRRLLDEADPHPDDFVAATNVREVRRLHERAVRLPTQLVKDIAHASSLAKEAWTKARGESKLLHFHTPLLGRLLDLKREVAERIGYEDEPFDALIDEYEPGARSKAIEAVFRELRSATVALLDRIRNASHEPDQRFSRATTRVRARR